MEDMNESANIPGEPPLDDGYHEELEEALLDLRELENMKKFLEEENEKSRGEIDTLTSEIEGMDISTSATHAHLESYEQRKNKYLNDMERQKAKKEALTAEVNEILLKTRAAKEDEESTAILINTLKDELEDIRIEKAIVIKMLDSLSAGIGRISHDRESRLPRLHGYHKVCKQIQSVLRETQNRMEVSQKLRKPWIS